PYPAPVRGNGATHPPVDRRWRPQRGCRRRRRRPLRPVAAHRNASDATRESLRERVEGLRTYECGDRCPTVTVGFATVNDGQVGHHRLAELRADDPAFLARTSRAPACRYGADRGACPGAFCTPLCCRDSSRPDTKERSS